MTFNVTNYINHPDFQGYDAEDVLRVLSVKSYVLIPLMVIFSIVYVISTVMFVVKSRTSKDLRRRSVGLTLVGSVLGFFTFFVYSLRSVSDIFCSVFMWPTYIGLAHAYMVILLQAFRLWIMNTTNQAKVLRLENPDQLQSFWGRHQVWFKEDRLDRLLLLTLGLVTCPMLIMIAIIEVVSPVYGIRVHEIWCTMTWEIIPVVVMLALLVVVVYPIVMYFVKDIDDGYQIRHDLTIACISSLIFVPAFFIMETAAPRNKEMYFNSTLFIACNMLTLQIMSVIAPLWKLRRRHLGLRVQGMTASETFVRIVENPKWMVRLCKFCESNFCSELPLFLIEYQQLKQWVFDRPSHESTERTHLLGFEVNEKQSFDRSPALIPVPPVISDDPTYPPALSPSQQPPGTDTWTQRLNGSTLLDKKDLGHRYQRFMDRLLSLKLGTTSSTEHGHGVDRTERIPMTTSIQDLLRHHKDRRVLAPVDTYYHIFYERFFTPGSIWEINLRGKTRIKIMQAMDQGMPTFAMFDAAKDEVCQLLNQDILPKFIAANYHELCDF